MRAKAIIAGRPYADKQDLVSRKILPANVFTAIQDRIALVNVNTASAADMAKILPNVGPVRAAAIVKARPFAAPQDMVTKGALTQGVFDGIKNLVTAG
jgi:DNA uptake protein ComE-like DNA-binding protein